MPLGKAVGVKLKGRLAVVLAGVAGYVNVVTLMFLGATTSHVTGNITHLGQAVTVAAEGRNGWLLPYFAGLVAAFFLGAMASSCITATASGRWRIVRTLGLEATLLAVLAAAVSLNWTGGYGGWRALSLTLLAAMAMGMQNAMIVHVKEAIVRTTHMTGVVTDMGIDTGRLLLWAAAGRRAGVARVARNQRMAVFLRLLRRHPAMRRLALHTRLLTAFTLGAVLGTALYDFWPAWCMWLPVSVLMAATAREAWIHRTARQPTPAPLQEAHRG